jgi:hypothetical protein
MSISTNGFDLCLDDNPDRIMTHSVPLIEPVPDKVQQVFSFFGEPYQTAAGSILLLQEGRPPRRVRDESLVFQ